jgi:hypothetical protein
MRLGKPSSMYPMQEPCAEEIHFLYTRHGIEVVFDPRNTVMRVFYTPAAAARVLGHPVTSTAIVRELGPAPKHGSYTLRGKPYRWLYYPRLGLQANLTGRGRLQQISVEDPKPIPRTASMSPTKTIGVAKAVER